MTVLVVTTGDEDRAKTLAKKHAGRWAHVEFRALAGAALARALRDEAARLGVGLAEDGLAALLESTGTDVGRARNELAKLRAALGEGGTVDVEAVDRYVAGYEHHTVFAITDAVGHRDLAGSLRLLSEVTFAKDEEFLGLLGQIGKRLRTLWYLAGGDREIPQEFRPYPGLAGKLAPDARKFTRTEIERGLEGLRVLDDRVKSTQVPPKLLLEHFLVGFLSR
jgi:DNA polymerase III delta subunit